MIDSKRNTLWFLSILALALGCDATRNTDPSAGAPGLAGPRATIQDGNNNAGNEHFYWLRPMVTPPASFTGTFDPTQAPEIRICALFADLSGCDGADIAGFGTNTGSGSEIVRVEPGGEHYIVNWHTNQYNLDPAKHYRIRAYVGDNLLGVADVDVIESGKELRNVNTGEYIALLDNGTLPIRFRIEEGAVPEGEPDIEPGAISAGGFHSCGLASDGQAYCWGTNINGELGNGTFAYGTHDTPYSATPSKVIMPAGVRFSQIAAHGGGTCALATTGQAYCWGLGVTGLLGNGTFTFIQPTPVAVAGGHIFTTLAAGHGLHSCGLKADQSAWCWGYDIFGQLGNDDALDDQNTPRMVAGGLRFRSLSIGVYHTCGVRTDGSAYCWGEGSSGQLGIANGAVIQQPTPAPVLGGRTFASIDAGSNHTCALTSDGSAWCWGFNRLGSGGTGSHSPEFNYAPAAVSGGLSFTALSAGRWHSCGLVAGGSAYCWGSNLNGQLGNGFAQPEGLNTPTAVVGGFFFAAISAGWEHTCGVTSTGEGKCWGQDGGQLGDGTASSSPVLTPAAVTGGLMFRTP